ncbi:YjbF family lipoprotein [Siccirubricoccus deserti]|uniref:YjbF family lipoprotein n=1 Tax=Siccirubricoccus deserti TaxID=2013562 RepID=A0A9X0UFB2_9PROT|nr:YjbF family lipoprotein [Siccirubricoccus deserti]MBC4014230.1 YjbF family lipoprotein [Siccirubricoccus deserti]
MHPRLAWLVLLALLPGGCGNSGMAGLLPALGWPEVLQRLPIATEEEPVADPATGRAIRLWIGRRGTRAALLQELGERRLWRTSSGVVVATDGGRVVATSGLREVLAATRFDGPDPLANPAALLDRTVEARRMVDLMRADREPAGMRFGIAVECRLRARRTEEDAVLLVEERCRAGREGRFTNRYWVAPEGGAVLRAEQWVGPGAPVLALEFSPAS